LYKKNKKKSLKDRRVLIHCRKNKKERKSVISRIEEYRDFLKEMQNKKVLVK